MTGNVDRSKIVAACSTVAGVLNAVASSSPAFPHADMPVTSAPPNKVVQAEALVFMLGYGALCLTVEVTAEKSDEAPCTKIATDANKPRDYAKSQQHPVS